MVDDNINIAPQDREVLDNFTAMTVGQIFTKARQAQNVELSQVAEHLNISTPHLEAIESDNQNGLPPKVYAIGFVRAYADLLGLDSEKMAYLFKSQFYKAQNLSTPEHHKNAHQKASLIQKIIDRFGDYILGGTIFISIALILGAVIWLFLSMSNDDELAVPPVPQEMINPLENQPQFDAESIEPVSEPMQLIVRPGDKAKGYGGEPLTSPLVFKAIEKTWIEIMPVTGKDALISRTLKTGDVFYTPADTDILLTTGNAGGIEVYLDGQKLGTLGEKAEIIRLRPFSVKALRLQLAQ